MRALRKVLAVASTALAVATVSSCGQAGPVAATQLTVPAATTMQPHAPPPVPPPAPTWQPAVTADFGAVSRLVNDAIGARKLPGAVVEVGHAGQVVLRQAYGLRKLAGEPGLDGRPAAAEPMTEDTVFDVASLTKCLATATAIMQLVEHGLLLLDDPVQRYLPEFNRAADPQRAAVTVRMLLTHTSGEVPDVNLEDPWGLAGADKAEGLTRALTAPLISPPGEVFRYSDINFIILGAMVEKITRQSLDVYAQRYVFTPLGMSDTQYLPAAKACGPHRMWGSVLGWSPGPPETCPTGTWSTGLLPRIAPTAHDDENWRDPTRNPDFGRLLRASVHDTTARRMGGVAGHAGVFSTARDIGVFAQALIDRLSNRPSAFPLTVSTAQLMTTPAQPGHNARQVPAANRASIAAAAKTPNLRHPMLAPSYPAIPGQNLRGLGWDIDTAFSQPRGIVFPIGSFGHTGFTGTALWIDPGSDSYVVLLANAIHPRVNPPISILRGEVATAAARALGLYGSAR
ncbi:serine hydrolase domain-containing protein [Mycobacterium sp. WMMD1722]|uniref:serine hydrolase domain-containing protein n=1 Tax=Mycobacterium sp. WMMD1722 TaxID=3404117 RepID=UPI003BF48B99